MSVFAHLPILPILIPLITAAALIPIDDRNRDLKGVVSVVSSAIVFLVSLSLMYAAADQPEGRPLVYLLGNWAAPYGIVLVVDRLSALMLVLSSLVALGAQTFSIARWHRQGFHYHSLFQFMALGVNGAFLTGDLFNLFVFFEIMLGASYGLLLHGSGPMRVKKGLHYIAINLAASSLFLLGVSLIYGATGTLNMADLALRIGQLNVENRMLMEAGAALLGMAFLVKAAMWPLGFWLAGAYAAASPPSAAFFAILTKVGAYILLRLSMLLFGAAAGPSAGFGLNVLLYGGLITILFGLIGVLASQALGRLAAYCIITSSGTLLAAIGIADKAVIAGALLYLVTSTLAAAALFLLIELMERARDAGADVLAVTMEAYGDDDQVETEVGVAVPRTMALLGLCFVITTMLLAGLPPFSGFLAKVSILHGLFGSGPPGAALSFHGLDGAQWTYVVLLILSGLSTLIAMNRVGIRTFWTSIEGTVPRVYLIEIAPIMLLLGACLVLTLGAGSALSYLDATASALVNPQSYIEPVLSAPRVPSPGEP
ncbi:monovalent cation/H+ antiporter subunit D [Rhizobium rhizosphaerae]|uniref:Monovalent cation/H+ antiporter subunit D n=1 Tax=Xaviernesmea rhizosphaerae TaxID=1672749 RepID=A0A1Q9APK3_9HYPH|nr:monovalent cation/H+ antiporter subunit D [Xaviernesmea rhizosphaerae]OLP57354.1 monovalent cation/H+ antiporter subunit D [Xaviernesmea rhizosphaerae]OQP84751.1 monovalent cation/H+ antiporter subunit D [Xaviernesmea rhizosphaerae]